MFKYDVIEILFPMLSDNDMLEVHSMADYVKWAKKNMHPTFRNFERGIVYSPKTKEVENGIYLNRKGSIQYRTSLLS